VASSVKPHRRTAMTDGNVRISIELLDRLEADQRRLEWLVNEAREYNRDLWILLHSESWRDVIDAEMQEVDV
jgi:hypothetical protein